jgi:predicted RNA-binding protein with PIN domain
VALHIVIDGYNLIGSEKGLVGKLEGKRNELIHQLRNYQERKSYEITLVFDGWRSGGVYEAEERIGGIRVIYSRQGEKADSVIQRLAGEMGSGCIVVTSDREVRRAVEAVGAVPIYAGEFAAKLRTLDREISEEQREDSGSIRRGDKKGNPRKLSKTERKRRERLKKL